MGNTCTSAYQPSDEVPAVESTIVYSQIDEETGKTVEEQVGYAVEKSDEGKEAVKSTMEEIKEQVEEVVEEIAAAQVGVDASAVVASQEKEETVAAKPDACTDFVDQPPGQKPLVDPLTLLVGVKGQKPQTVQFLHKSLGFEYSSKRAGCAPCGSKGNVAAEVTKVEANQQAATLGVQCGAIIYEVNGEEITDTNQLQKLIADHLPKLAEEPVCN
jgi:S1-C subfamily serine protease